ncbi:hypothetical protein SAMN05216376_11031 [Mameliella alba]|nr:hypothetical protein CDZ96_17450 [Mameliella alba]PTR37722.1 hypothetical protein LX94_03542 [Mameliella alba]GGF50489.1 hypothetical protein GCM10011319_10080 [Mameliella alba]SDD62739.1 hypothetical protein SAMN05216376_11031 [Mameliella alba]
MSDASTPKAKKITTAQEFVSQNAQTRQTEVAKAKDEPSGAERSFAAIQDNTFYKIMLDEGLAPQDKLARVTQALTFTDDRSEARENLSEFNAFKEYLQFERKRMAQEIIALTDTEAFGELKDVFEQINTALLTFEDQIAPLTDIVDAVYTLRMNGVTYDIFEELLRERELEKERTTKKADLKQTLSQLESKVRGLKTDNGMLREDKGFFGLGGTKKSALEKIAANDALIDEHTDAMQSLLDEIKILETQAPANSEFAEFAAEKEKLRELLDITSDEHKARQEALVGSAQDFIDTTENRVSSVLGHFTKMNGQIDNLDEANFTMRSMYAILSDATKQVDGANETRRQQIRSAIDAAESDLERLGQERLERDINDYISNLGRSNVDTTSVLAELTASGHRIHSMKDANAQQVAKTRQLHTSGVAGVADQLSTVLQAVSAAALGESSEAAKMSLERMNRTTSELGQREVIRVALGTKEINQDLTNALSELSEYGETIKAATHITREGLTETKDLLAQIERQTAETQAAVKESLSVAADVAGGKGGTRNPSPADVAQEAEERNAPPNPFGLGKS